MWKVLFSLVPVVCFGIFFPDLIFGVGIYVLAVSLFTFISYGSDKFFAVMHWRRIPEDFLIVLGFFGGAPGAFAGMKLFHHKTLKKYFDRALYTAVILQTVVIFVAHLVNKG